MKDNFKYYFVERKSDQAYPLLDILEENPDLWELEFGDPIPRKPVMADYLSGARDVLSKRIVEVMKKLNMEGVRFIPAEIDDTKGNIYDNYECVVADDNTYELLDLEKSDYDVDDDDEDDLTYDVRKVVIDRVKLNKIP